MHAHGISTVNNTRITLELKAGADPIRGTIEHADGMRQPFWGWMQLIQAIEDAITNPAGPTSITRHDRMEEQR